MGSEMCIRDRLRRSGRSGVLNRLLGFYFFNVLGGRLLFLVFVVQFDGWGSEGVFGYL